jgi:hypothetical protein
MILHLFQFQIGELALTGVAELLDIAFSPFPGTPIRKVLQTSCGLITREMANDSGLIFEDMRIDFDQGIYKIFLHVTRRILKIDTFTECPILLQA